MKHNINKNSFNIIQSLIKTHNTTPSFYPKHQLHLLLTSYDKNSLKMKANFNPLQNILKNQTNNFLKDRTVTQNMTLLSNLNNIYTFLNLYDTQLLNYSLSKLISQIKNKQSNNISQKSLTLQNIFKIYRAIIQLNHHQSSQLRLIRQQLKSKIILFLQNIKEVDIYYHIQRIHGMVKYMILDPKRDEELIEILMKGLEERFNTIIENNDGIHSDRNFPYSNTSSLYQLLKVYNIFLKGQSQSSQSSSYLQFLKRCYLSNLAIVKSTQSSTSKEYITKGQSIFQIRFQKHLIQNGYWFDRNIKIGIHQYDILIKGISRQEYYPFKNLNIDNFDYKQFRPINQQQRGIYQRNVHLWFNQCYKKFKKNMLINLNGPYHFIYGDKEGLIRSQEIKMDIARYYGYQEFRVIDYKQWQRETPNKYKVKEYLNKFINQKIILQS